MNTPDLPPASGYSDQPQGKVCPPVQTGGAASIRTCRSCGKSRPVCEFRRRRVCRLCEIEYRKEWGQRNRDTVRSLNSASRKRNPQAAKERLYRWRADNPEQARAIDAASKSRHPERKKIENAKRRARIRGARIGDSACLRRFYAAAHTSEELPCSICGCATTLATRHVDHVVPLCAGGKHSVENLAVTCSTCNLKKGSKHV